MELHPEKDQTPRSYSRHTNKVIVIFGIVRSAAFVLCRVITLSCVRDYKGNKEFPEFTLGFMSNKRMEGEKGADREREKRKREEGEEEKARVSVKNIDTIVCRKFSMHSFLFGFIFSIVIILFLNKYYSRIGN